MSFFISSTLSVSQKEKLNCREMAEYLSKFGIITSITSNISTQPELEYGCRLSQGIVSKNDIDFIWGKLSKKYNFQCAHLSIPNKFDGCILDYLNPTMCSNK